MEKLLNKDIAEQIQKHLSGMVNPVTMVLFTQDDEASCTHCEETTQLLTEVSELSDKITLVLKDIIDDAEEALLYNVTMTPSFVMLNSDGVYSGVQFNGIPAGHEINSFLSGLLGMSGADNGFDEKTIARIKKINKPVDIKVFVTTSCPHCPGAVAKAHQLSMLNENISGMMIEANSFHELSRKYNVSGVPKIVINDTIEMLGDQPLEEFIKRLEQL
jgi:glutaredoxin-like protein